MFYIFHCQQITINWYKGTIYCVQRSDSLIGYQCFYAALDVEYTGNICGVSAAEMMNFHSSIYLQLYDLNCAFRGISSQHAFAVQTLVVRGVRSISVGAGGSSEIVSRCSFIQYRVYSLRLGEIVEWVKQINAVHLLNWCAPSQSPALPVGLGCIRGRGRGRPEWPSLEAAFPPPPSHPHAHTHTPLPQREHCMSPSE